MKIIGSHRDDLLSGTDSSDLIFGNDGDDHIFANGLDILVGTAREQVYAGQGNDVIGCFSLVLDDLKHSSSYGSTIDGGAGHDSLFLGISSGDTLVNLARARAAFRLSGVEDLYYCVTGVDKQRVIGTDKADTIIVSNANVTTSAGNGSDYIFANEGNDVINGDNGKDFISAGNGHNVVSGGGGADCFHFYFEDSVEEYTEIKDFEHGVDKIIIQFQTDTDITDLGEAHQFVNFLTGREIDKQSFKHDSDFFGRNVIYERETGSVIFGGALIAHLDGNPNVTESDFLFSYPDP